MMPKKVLIISGRDLKEVIGSCEFWGIAYEIANVDKDGKINLGSISERRRKLTKQIRGAKSDMCFAGMDIKSAKEDIQNKKKYIKKLEGEIRRLKK